MDLGMMRQPTVPMDTKSETWVPETIEQFLKRVPCPEIKFSTTSRAEPVVITTSNPELARVKTMIYFNREKLNALLLEIGDCKVIEESLFRRYMDIGGLVFFKNDAQLLVRLVKELV